MRNKVIFGLSGAVILIGYVDITSRHGASATREASRLADTSKPDLDPSLSASPRRRISTNHDPAPDSIVTPTTNLLVRLIAGDEPPKLAPWQLEPYLELNRRSPNSLLAALQATGDQSFLLEAMTKFPTNPQVALAAVFKHDSTPEERHQWLTNLKQADPGNALANYLAASECIKAGEKDQALQEMTAASAKTSCDDYSRLMIQNAEEAYLAAGYSVLDAKTAACAELLMPQLPQLKALAQGLGEVAATYQQAGDMQSAQATLQMSLDLGERIAGRLDQSLVTTLVGIAIQRLALSSMPPTDLLGDSGVTVQDRIADLGKTREGFKTLTQQFDGIMTSLPDSEAISYFDRTKTFGEAEAMRWLIGRFGHE